MFEQFIDRICRPKEECAVVGLSRQHITRLEKAGHCERRFSGPGARSLGATRIPENARFRRGGHGHLLLGRFSLPMIQTSARLRDSRFLRREENGRLGREGSNWMRT